MNYVIIGNGPAAVHAVESIRQRDALGKITLISKEDNAPYCRIMVPELMSGELEDDSLYYRGTDFYERYDVTCRLGETVSGITADEKKILLENGESICYDKLLIASGSRAVSLPFMQNPPAGVFTLWDKADARKLQEFLKGNVKQIVIVGGGLVGLQAARALAGSGREITVVESLGWLMPAQLDETAGLMLTEAARKAGLRVMCGTRVEAFETADGRVTGLQTDSGRLQAQLVLVAVGVKPNIDFAVGKGLNIERAIIVNDEMRTNIPDIFAAGDAAQAPGLLEGTNLLRPLWLCAVKQGKVAGANMAGDSLHYEGSVAMNSIDLFGLQLISMGRLSGADLEEIVLCPPGRGIYKKLLLCQNKLMGFILAGDIRQAGILAAKLGRILGENYSGDYKNINPALMTNDNVRSIKYGGSGN